MNLCSPSRTLDISSIDPKKKSILFHLFDNSFSPKEKSSSTNDFVFISNINSSVTLSKRKKGVDGPLKDN